jgi:hypothetical protein
LLEFHDDVAAEAVKIALAEEAQGHPRNYCDYTIDYQRWGGSAVTGSRTGATGWLAQGLYLADTRSYL